MTERSMNLTRSQEYQRSQALFHAQPALVQRFIELQAQRLAAAVVDHRPQMEFTLPDQVIGESTLSESTRSGQPMQVVEAARSCELRTHYQTMHNVLRQKLDELEQASDPALRTCGALLRYATAIHLVYNVLPAGRPVTYCASEGDMIPTLPVWAVHKNGSALTAAADAIAEQDEDGRGEEGWVDNPPRQVPYVPAARAFFLPQWVAFGTEGELLVKSAAEAEAIQASLQRYLAILHTASALAPYMVADETYQRKRYGILGQTINQGRALACYKTRELIQTILARAQRGSLNRGLRINLDYYDDQELQMRELPLVIIPAGRIMFNSAFVVRAVRLEQAKVQYDTRYNRSTRSHLLHELRLLEEPFADIVLTHTIMSTSI